MTESLSLRLKPSAARPRAMSRTWSWYWRQVNVCQMPRSFSRMAGRPAYWAALRSRQRGRVSRSAITSLRRRLGVAEIGLDHLRIGADLGGGAIGDLDAHVEYRHPVRDVHHHTHVVLDEDDGRPPLLVDVEDEARHVLLLLVVAATHRLVEQEHSRVERERPAELDALLEPVGERAGGPAPEVLDLEEVDDVLDALAVLDLLALREPPVDERLEH